MKKILKVLLIILMSIISIGIIGFAWGKNFVSTNWGNYYTEAELNNFAQSINESPSLPSNIYKAYELLNPGHLNQKISDMENSVIWNILIGNKRKLQESQQCNCVNAAVRFENRFPMNYHSFSRLMLGHGLEQKTNELKCFDFLYHSYLTRLNETYFNKAIGSLTFKESVELVVLFEHPTRYKSNVSALKEHVTQLLNQAANNNTYE